jgi:hypothetical protein
MDCESAADGNTDASEPFAVLASQRKGFTSQEQEELTILLGDPLTKHETAETFQVYETIQETIVSAVAAQFQSHLNYILAVAVISQ